MRPPQRAAGVELQRTCYPSCTKTFSATLASLHGAPASIAQATIQLLPFGSRAALQTLGLATLGRAIDADGHRTLTLTSFAYEVMAEAGGGGRG